MKKSVMLFLLSLLTVISCFSQTTYPKILNDSLIVISPTQLKQTNLIFLEHKSLKLKNIELQNQVSLKDSLIYSYQQVDSLKEIKIKTLNEYATKANETIQKQESSIKKSKVTKGFLVGSGILNIILLGILIL